MARKKVEAPVEPERNIHRDFTVSEFDEFTLGLLLDGARHERAAIGEELERVAAQMKKLSMMLTNDDAETFELYAAGLAMAARVIAEMRDPEDNVGCQECGAI